MATFLDVVAGFTALVRNLMLSITICCSILFIVITLRARIFSLSGSEPVPPNIGKEPPLAPYSIPYLQHLLPFLSNPRSLIRTLNKKYNGPFSITMMNTKFHIFSSPTATSKIFGKSRNFMFDPVVASMLENGLDFPAVDRPKVNVPVTDKKSTTSADGLRPHDFVSANHKTYIKYLSGSWLEDIMLRYMHDFFSVVNDALGANATMGDSKSVQLHDTMEKLVFDTSAKTFFGSRLDHFWPDKWKDFKHFNDATYTGVRSNFSYFLQPRAFTARERMLQAFEKWADCDVEDWESADAVWREKWGIRMNWEREKVFREAGFSYRGKACLHASFLFVIVTNSAPMLSWFLVNIIQSPERLAKFRKEARENLLPQHNSNPDDMRFDMAGLKANPFMQGLWKEALRLGSNSAAARVVSTDTTLDGYILKKGSVVLLPVTLIHFDPDVFPNEEEFMPERWINSLGENASEDEKFAENEKQKQQVNRLRAFGGGTGLCSGRFVAELEVLGTAAMILLLFDIEMEEEKEKYRLNPRSLGIMSPMVDPRVTIKKRRFPRSAVDDGE